MIASVCLQANPAGRLQTSLVRQFAQQEARSLLTRTKPKRGIEHPETVCYVIKAVEDGGTEESIVGTLDLKLPACASGCHPQEVPLVSDGFLTGTIVNYYEYAMLIRAFFCHF